MVSIAESRQTRRPAKNPVIILASMAVSIVFLVLILKWMWRLHLHDVWFSTLAHLTSVFWAIVLFWALYQIIFELASLWPWLRGGAQPLVGYSDAPDQLKLVVMYLTCDDFQEYACLSCLDQSYPSDQYRVIICDDSRDAVQRERIDDCAKRHPRIRIVRRPDPCGLKAGNLNYVIKRSMRSAEHWIVIVDADQVLPHEYLANVARAATSQAERVAFIQGRQASDHCCHRSFEGVSATLPPATPFQEALGLEIGVIYNCILPCREQYGFLPMMGHGVAVRKEAWEEVRGFPALVFEDFGFALAACNRGWYGVYAEDMCSWEAFPQDFAAFVTRYRRYAGGAAQFMKYMISSMTQRIRLVEVLDLIAILLWYLVVPSLAINGFLGVFVFSRLWDLDISPLSPSLAIVFVVLHILVVPLHLSAAPSSLTFTESLVASVRSWFWALAIHSSCLPIGAWRFCKHLVLRRPPSFDRTPKAFSKSPCFVKYAWVLVPLGVCAVALACIFRSPFSPVLGAQGVAYASFPVYGYLHESTFRGGAARMLVMVPGVLWLWALGGLYAWAFP